MRTLVIILAGFAVWGACLGIARLSAATSKSSMTIATIAFAAIWFIAAAVNMLQFFWCLSRYRCL